MLHLYHIASVIKNINDIEYIYVDGAASLDTLVGELALSPFPYIDNKQPLYINKDNNLDVRYTLNGSLFCVFLYYNDTCIFNKCFDVTGTKAPPYQRAEGLYDFYFELAKMSYNSAIQRDDLFNKIITLFEPVGAFFIAYDECGNTHKLIFSVDTSPKRVKMYNNNIEYQTNMSIQINDCQIFNNKINLIIEI